ncbi:MAG: hypothetical protein Q9210_003388 [Variospora velana]
MMFHFGSKYSRSNSLPIIAVDSKDPAAKTDPKYHGYTAEDWNRAGHIIRRHLEIIKTEKNRAAANRESTRQQIQEAEQPPTALAAKEARGGKKGGTRQ